MTADRQLFRHRWLVGLMIVLLPWIVFWRGSTMRWLLGDGDAVVFELPMRMLVAQMWRHGQLPLWTPLLRSGSPLAANIQAAAWYPGTLLFLWLPPVVAYNVHTLLHLSLAGWGMYRLMQALGCTVGSAMLSSVVYPCSGYVLAYISNAGMLSTVAWLPLLLWFAERLTHPQARRFLMGLAIGCYCVIVAGHPQLACYCLLALTGFVVCRATSMPGEERMMYLWVSFAGVLAGVMLAAVLLVPTIELFCQDTFAGRMPFADFTKGSLSWRDLIWSLFSYRFSNMVRHSGAVEFAFVGFLPVVLAATTLPMALRSKFRFWWGLLLLGAVLAVGRHTPLPNLFYSLPLIDVMRCPGRQLLFAMIALAVLAGLGTDQLARAATDGRGRAVMGWAIGTILFLTHTVAFRMASTFLFKGYWRRLQGWDAGRPLSDLLFRFTSSEWRVAITIIVMWCLAMVALFWWVRRYRGRVPVLWVLCAITVFHIWANSRWIFAMPVDRLEAGLARRPSLPAVFEKSTALQPDRLYRIVPYVLHWPVLANPRVSSVEWHQRYMSLLGPNTNIFSGVPSIAGMGRLGRRSYAELLGMDLAGILLDGKVFDPSHQLLRLLNVRYVLTDDSRVGVRFDRADRYRVFARQPDLGATIYERLEPSAPFWFVREVRTAPEDEILTVLRSGRDRHGDAVDLYATALLLEDAQAQTTIPSDSTDESEVDTVPSITGMREYGPLAIRLTLSVPRHSFLVLSEIVYPGWKAWIDGRQVPIHATDLLLRGVTVPAGASELVMRYRPGSFLLGAALSLLACGGLIAYWLYPVRRVRQAPQ